MKKQIIITFILSATMLLANSQNATLARFAVWQPKDGQEQKFEAGYKQHLKWHEANHDTWDWYGWYIISGPRYGQFVDATFNHTWSDFDKAIKPTDDIADNRLHVSPFGHLQSMYTIAFQPALSIIDSNSLQSKFLRLLTITVIDASNAENLFEKLKETFKRKFNHQPILVFKMIDGDNLSQFQLMLPFMSYTDYGKIENILEEVSQIESSMKMKIISNIISETLIYRSDMSLLAKKKEHTP